MSDLQKFLSDISSIYWWISVIIVGLLVSLTGDFLSNLIDKIASRSLKSFREKSEKRKIETIEKDNALIEELIKSPKYFMWYQSRTVTRPLMSFLYIILGTVFIVISILYSSTSIWLNYITQFFSIAIAFLGLRILLVANKRNEIIYRIIDKELEEKE